MLLSRGQQNDAESHLLPKATKAEVTGLQVTLSAGLYELTADLLRFVVPPNAETQVFEMLSQQAGHHKAVVPETLNQPHKVSPLISRPTNWHGSFQLFENV